MRLDRLQKTYAKRGLRLVVISPFEVSTLKERLVGEYGAKYWIGCDPHLETTIGFIVPNTPAEFPMQYLVDVRGTIVDHGGDLDGKIEQLLEEVHDPALGRDLHPALKFARRSYDRGMIGSAWKSAGGKLEDEDPAVVADATFLRERCEAFGAWKRRMIERALDRKEYPTAVADLDQVAKAFRPMPVATWAADQKRELQRDPEIKVELDAWARLEKAIAKEGKAKGSPKKMRSVRKEYRAIVKKYPGTLAAREARRRIDR